MQLLRGSPHFALGTLGGHYQSFKQQITPRLSDPVSTSLAFIQAHNTAEKYASAEAKKRDQCDFRRSRISIVSFLPWRKRPSNDREAICTSTIFCYKESKRRTYDVASLPRS